VLLLRLLGLFSNAMHRPRLRNQRSIHRQSLGVADDLGGRGIRWVDISTAQMAGLEIPRRVGGAAGEMLPPTRPESDKAKLWRRA
jgi:hypothetical protein